MCVPHRQAWALETSPVGSSTASLPWMQGQASFVLKKAEPPSVGCLGHYMELTPQHQMDLTGARSC